VRQIVASCYKCDDAALSDKRVDVFTRMDSSGGLDWSIC
jgi:hypothetical protein